MCGKLGVLGVRTASSLTFFNMLKSLDFFLGTVANFFFFIFLLEEAKGQINFGSDI